MRSPDDYSSLEGLPKGEVLQELRYLRGIAERNAAKILSLDSQSIAIRHELEQKRRGFTLLAELAVTSRHDMNYESVFASVARRINAALNMERTVVLLPAKRNPEEMFGEKSEEFEVEVLQGYPTDREKTIAAQTIRVDAELLNPDLPVLVTGADSLQRLASLRKALELPYLISSPLFLHNEAAAILITGRMQEQLPFFPRLGLHDVETVQTVSAHLVAVLTEQRLVEAEKAMLAEMLKTEEKLRQAWDLAEKNARAKSEFLANVSHEIRTPMNAILGMTHLLATAKLDDKARKYVDQAAHSADILLHVIDDILEFSQIDTGRMKLEISKFSLRDLMRNVQEMIEEQAKAKSLTLNVHIAPDVPDSLLGDALRLEQVLLNLGNNAVKFTVTGKINIHVFSRTSLPSRTQLLFEVEDTGIGMDKEQTEYLFSPFTQADASTTRKYGGLGLGLAISWSLVEMMGGEIQCESWIGKGSKFSFFVFCGLPEEGEQSEPKEGEVKRKNAGELFPLVEDVPGLDDLCGMRVLLVEDNEINRMIATELLSDMGVVVSTAENGLDALETLKDNEYDIILMDIQMPKMDGLTATSHIRANPKYADLPILALTAHALAEDREESLLSGMNDHLTKPIDPDQLFESLKQWDKRPKNGI
ncbi:MAG: response regulator [Synergistaceae bacterium]|jgi:signal transduction histidine kinase/BarA-like signal transduction histidine kinase|nr:response regulator [Synergistaceae bacterium]